MTTLNMLEPSPAIRLHDWCVDFLDRFTKRVGEITQEHGSAFMFTAAHLIKMATRDGMRFRLPDEGCLLEIEPGSYKPAMDKWPHPMIVLDWRYDQIQAGLLDADGDFQPIESVLVVFERLRDFCEAIRETDPDLASMDVSGAPDYPCCFVAHRSPRILMESLLEDGYDPRDIEWFIEPTMMCLDVDNFGIELSEDDNGNCLLSLKGASAKPLFKNEALGDVDFESWTRSMIVLAQFLTAIQCTNVSPVELPTNGKFMAARHKRGKTIWSSWHTLNVCLPSSTGEIVSSGYGGSHASPRFHLRRGHVRRYKIGKTTWVRSCAVGRHEIGTVIKDYQVNP